MAEHCVNLKDPRVQQLFVELDNESRTNIIKVASDIANWQTHTDSMDIPTASQLKEFTGTKTSAIARWEALPGAKNGNQITIFKYVRSDLNTYAQQYGVKIKEAVDGKNRPGYTVSIPKPDSKQSQELNGIDSSVFNIDAKISKFDFATAHHVNKLLTHAAFAELETLKGLTLKDFIKDNKDVKDVILERFGNFVGEQMAALEAEGTPMTQEQHDVISNIAEDLYSDTGTLWDGFVNYMSSIYDVRIENVEEIVAERSVEEIPTHWDDKNQFKLDNKRSIQAKIKLELSSIVKGRSPITGLQEIMDLDTLISRLINAHRNDSTDGDFMHTLEYIATHELPDLRDFIGRLVQDENLFAAYKSALNFDMAETFAIVSGKYANEIVFDNLNSNRKSFTHNRDYDLWYKEIDRKISTGQLKFLRPLIESTLANARKTGEVSSTAFQRITLKDILGREFAYTPDDFIVLAAYLQELGVNVTADAFIAEYDSPNYVRLPNRQEAFYKYVLQPITYLVGDIAYAVSKNQKRYTTNESGSLYKIARFNSRYSQTRTQLDYLNVNNDTIYTPIYQSYIGRLFKGLTSPQAVIDKFEPFIQDKRFYYSNFLWNNNKDGNGIFNYTEKDGVRTLNKNAPVNMDFVAKLVPKLFNGTKMVTDGIGLEYTEIFNNNWDLMRLIASNGKQSVYFIPTADAGRITSLPMFFGWDKDTIQKKNVKAGEKVEDNLIFNKEGDYVGIKTDGKLFKLLKNTIYQELQEMKSLAQVLFDIDTDTGSITVKKEWTKKGNQVKLHPTKDWNGKVFFHTNPETGEVTFTGRSFQFLNLTYRTKENGKSVVHTLNDLFSDNRHLFTDINDSVVQERINRFIQDAISENIKQQVNKFSSIEGAALNLRQYGTRLTETESGSKKGAKLFKDAASFKKGIARYYVNNYLAQVEFSNFIVGNQSEYKNTLDLNKRASQIIKNGVTNNLTTTYRALTVQDNYLNSPFSEYLKKVAPKFLDNYIHDKHGVIETTNAITFITDVEFERRSKGFGRYDQLKAVIDDFKDENSPFDPDNYGTLLESQKYFYYSRGLSNTLSATSPRVLSQQYKNSTVILSRKSVKGTELEAMYDWMIHPKNNIDEINFASARKFGDSPAVQIFDKDGRFDPTQIGKNVPIDNAVRTLAHSNLIVQLDVVPHTLEEVNKFAVQLEKIILNNLDFKEAIYEIVGVEGKKNGQWVKEHYQKLISSGVKEGAIELLNEFGAVEDGKVKYILDINGNPTESIDIDYDKMIEYLQNYVKNNESSETLREALRIVDGQTALPLYSGLTYKKFTSILMALFTNNVITQKIPGIHGSLVPEVGLNIPKSKLLTDKDAAYLEYAKNGAIVYTEEFIERAKREPELGFKLRIGNEKGIKTVEIIVSPWLKEFYKEGQLIDINTLSDEARTMFGIRIPTEGKQSMVYAKVVGFFKTGASQIIAPYEFVNKTGWDFDIDSLYLYTKKLILGTDGIYNPIKFLDESTDVKDRYNNYLKTSKLTREVRVKYLNKLNRLYKSLNREVIDTNDLAAAYLERSELRNMIRDIILDDASDSPGFSKEAREGIANLQDTLEQVEATIKQLEALREIDAEVIEQKTKTIWDQIHKVEANRQKELEQVLSFNEFKSWSIEEQNTKAARAGRIIDIMSSIVSNDKHIQEYWKPNTMSNITEVGNYINALYGYDINGLNINNDFDAAVLRDLNMSVRTLKGNSVAWDGVMSILGQINAEHRPIRVNTKKSKYFKGLSKEAQKLFSLIGEDSVTITHFGNNALGSWVDSNGLKITDQSSEVTANILDAVKEVMGFNINGDTLSVFRLLSSNALSHVFNGKPNRFVLPYFFTHQPIIVELTKQLNIERAINLKTSVTSVGRQLLSDTKTELISLLADDINEVLQGENLYATVVIKGKEQQVKTTNPIITKVKKSIAQSGHIYLKNKAEYAALNDALYEVLNKFDAGYMNDAYIDDVTDLEHNIKTGIAINEGAELNISDKVNYLVSQHRALAKFLELNDIASNIVKAISTFNTDKLGVGPTFNVTRNLSDNITDLLFDSDKLFDYFTDEQKTEVYYGFIKEFNKTHIITEKLKLYKDLLQAYDLDSGQFSVLKVGNKTAVEAIYPILFGETTDPFSGVYPSLQSRLFYGNLLASATFEQFFPHEFGNLYNVRRNILNPLGLQYNEYAESVVINYINNVLVSQMPFLTDTNNEVIKDRMLAVNSNYNTGVGHTQVIFGPPRADLMELNINMEEPTPDDFRRFQSLALVDKIKLLLTSNVFKSIMKDDRYLGNHILDHVDLYDSVDEYLEKGYTHFRIGNTAEPNYLRQSLTDMYLAGGILGNMARSTAEDMIKMTYYLHGFSFGNNLSKYIDIRLLYDYNEDGRITLSQYSQMLRDRANEKGYLSSFPLIDNFFKANWNNKLFVPEAAEVLNKKGKVKRNSPTFTTYGELKLAEGSNSVNYNLALNQVIIESRERIENSPYRNNDFILVDIDGEKVLYKIFMPFDRDASDTIFYYPVVKTLPGENGETAIPAFYKFNPSTFIYTEDTYKNIIWSTYTEGANHIHQVHKLHNPYKIVSVESRKEAAKIYNDSQYPTVDLTNTEYSVKGLEKLLFDYNNTNLPVTKELLDLLNSKYGKDLKKGSLIKFTDSTGGILTARVQNITKPILRTLPKGKFDTEQYQLSKGDITLLGSTDATIFATFPTNISNTQGAKFLKDLLKQDITEQIVKKKEDIKHVFIYIPSNEISGNYATSQIAEVLTEFPDAIFYLDAATPSSQAANTIMSYIVRNNVPFVLFTEEGTVGNLTTTAASLMGVNTKALSDNIIQVEPVLRYESRELEIDAIHEFEGSTLEVVEALGDTSDLSVYIGDSQSLYAKQLAKSGRFINVNLDKSDKEVARDISNKISSTGNVRTLTILGDESKDLGFTQEQLNSRVSNIISAFTSTMATTLENINTLNTEGIGNAVRGNNSNIPVTTYSHVNSKNTFDPTKTRFSEELNLDGETLSTYGYNDIEFVSSQMNILADALANLAQFAKEYSDTPLPYKEELETLYHNITKTDKYNLLTKYDLTSIIEALTSQLTVLKPFSSHLLELDDQLQKIDLQQVGSLTYAEREVIARKIRQIGHIADAFDFIQHIRTIDIKRGDATTIQEANDIIAELRQLQESILPYIDKANTYAKLYIGGLYVEHGKNPKFKTRFNETVKAAIESDTELKERVQVNMSDEDMFTQYVKLLTENEAMTWTILNMDSAFNTGITLIDGVLKEFVAARTKKDNEVIAYVDKFNNLAKSYFGKGVNIKLFENLEDNTKDFVNKFVDTKYGTFRSEYKWGYFFQEKGKMYKEMRENNDKIEILREEIKQLSLKRKRGLIDYKLASQQIKDKRKSLGAIRKYKKVIEINWMEENQVLGEQAALTEEQLNELERQEELQTPDKFNEYLRRKRIMKVRHTGEYIKIIPKDDKYKDNNYAMLSDTDKTFINQYKEIIQDVIREAYPDLIVSDDFLPVATKQSIARTLKGHYGFRPINTRYIERGLGEELKYHVDMRMVNNTKQAYTIRYDIRRAGESIEEYNERIVKDVNDRFNGKKEFTTIAEIDAYNEQIEAENAAYIEKTRNFNPFDIMMQFINQAKEYQHIKGFENTLMLLLEQLASEEYKEDITTAKGRRHVDKVLSAIKGKKEHKKLTGTATTGYRRMVEFMPTYYGVSNVNSKFEQGLSIARNVTSLVYMGANVLGGIKNATKGYHDMLMESHAGRFLGYNELFWATGEYTKNIHNFLSSLGKEYFNDLIVAICNRPDALHLLELRDTDGNIISMKDNPHKFLALMNNAVYFSMNSTEHFMQFTMMLGMMRSHRVVGGLAMSFQEFAEINREQLLKEVLTDAQRKDFEEFKAKAEKSVSRYTDDYDFVRRWSERGDNITNQQRKQLSEKIRKQEETLKAKFDKYERVIDQFELMDSEGNRGKSGEVEGRAVLKEGSTINEEQLGMFMRKAHNLNQTLHGVYNRVDKMALRNKTVMDLAFQFRSWIKPNWDRYFGKRWGRSTFSEGLGTYQKGAYISLWDFITTPIRANKVYGEDTRSKLEATRNFFADYANFFLNAAYYYGNLPAHERANIKRATANFTGIMISTLSLLLLGKLVDDDDKNIENKLLALTIYELNMIHSEITQFVPGAGWHGFYVRTKQYPLASEKIFVDLWKLSSGIIKYPFQDDEARYYQTGAYKDRLRIEVLASKLSPLYRQKHKWDQLGMYTGWYKMYNPFSFMFGN